MYKRFVAFEKQHGDREGIEVRASTGEGRSWAGPGVLLCARPQRRAPGAAGEADVLLRGEAGL